MPMKVAMKFKLRVSLGGAAVQFNFPFLENKSWDPRLDNG
jgi:hypothetical protein